MSAGQVILGFLIFAIIATISGIVYMYYFQCKDVEEMIEGKCLVKCKDGKVRVANICTRVCKDGEELVGDKCLVKCTDGKTRVGDICTLVCKNGDELVGDKCLVKCTDGKTRVGVVCTTPGPKGYCIATPNNEKRFFIKTDNLPGWKEGDTCWGVDGTMGKWGEKDCLITDDSSMCQKVLNENVYFKY